jgi:putative tributyrin esterase
MGGYGEVKLALKLPELYGFVGSMSGAFDITRRPLSLRSWGQTWRIWTIFGTRRRVRQDEDVFALLDDERKNSGAGWFVSCGQVDSLHAVDELFVRRMRACGMIVDWTTTPSGHDWNSWNAAMPELFQAAAKSLR